MNVGNIVLRKKEEAQKQYERTQQQNNPGRGAYTPPMTLETKFPNDSRRTQDPPPVTPEPTFSNDSRRTQDPPPITPETPMNPSTPSGSPPSGSSSTGGRFWERWGYKSNDAQQSTRTINPQVNTAAGSNQGGSTRPDVQNQTIFPNASGQSQGGSTWSNGQNQTRIPNFNASHGNATSSNRQNQTRYPNFNPSPGGVPPLTEQNQTRFQNFNSPHVNATSSNGQNQTRSSNATDPSYGGSPNQNVQGDPYGFYQTVQSAYSTVTNVAHQVLSSDSLQNALSAATQSMSVILPASVLPHYVLAIAGVVGLSAYQGWRPDPQDTRSRPRRILVNTAWNGLFFTLGHAAPTVVPTVSAAASVLRPASMPNVSVASALGSTNWQALSVAPMTEAAVQVGRTFGPALVSTGVAYFTRRENESLPRRNPNEVEAKAVYMLPIFDANVVEALSNAQDQCHDDGEGHSIRVAYKIIVTCALTDVDRAYKVATSDYKTCVEADILCAWAEKTSQLCQKQIFNYGAMNNSQRMDELGNPSQMLKTHQQKPCRRMALLFASLRAAKILDVQQDDDFVPTKTNVHLYIMWNQPETLMLVYLNDQEVKTKDAIAVSEILLPFRVIMKVNTQTNALMGVIRNKLGHQLDLDWHMKVVW